jgi:hypothetical protein
MNNSSGRGIRENTVASFIAAHDSGAGWCEFDVQVTVGTDGYCSPLLQTNCKPSFLVLMASYDVAGTVH